jgi:hypothetical protein
VSSVLLTATMTLTLSTDVPPALVNIGCGHNPREMTPNRLAQDES